MTKNASLSSKCSETLGKAKNERFVYFESGKAGNVDFELEMPEMIVFSLFELGNVRKWSKLMLRA